VRDVFRRTRRQRGVTCVVVGLLDDAVFRLLVQAVVDVATGICKAVSWVKRMSVLETMFSSLRTPLSVKATSSSVPVGPFPKALATNKIEMTGGTTFSIRGVAAGRFFYGRQLKVRRDRADNTGEEGDEQAFHHARTSGSVIRIHGE
jgi:hypothetical protein